VSRARAGYIVIALTPGVLFLVLRPHSALTVLSLLLCYGASVEVKHIARAGCVGEGFLAE
jgi:hypothetical protein